MTRGGQRRRRRLRFEGLLLRDAEVDIATQGAAFGSALGLRTRCRTAAQRGGVGIGEARRCEPRQQES